MFPQKSFQNKKDNLLPQCYAGQLMLTPFSSLLPIQHTSSPDKKSIRNRNGTLQDSNKCIENDTTQPRSHLPQVTTYGACGSRPPRWNNPDPSFVKNSDGNK